MSVIYVNSVLNTEYTDCSVAGKRRLVIPSIKLSTVGNRSFPVAAAQVLNGLPEAVISSSSLQTFLRQLKTHLFQLSYTHRIL